MRSIATNDAKWLKDSCSHVPSAFASNFKNGFYNNNNNNNNNLFRFYMKNFQCTAYTVLIQVSVQLTM